MPFLLLLVLSLTSLQRDWPQPQEWLGWQGSVLLTWSTMACLGASAWLVAHRWGRQLQRDPGARSQVVGRYSGFRRWHCYTLLVTYFLLVCFGGWGWCVADWLMDADVVVPGIDLIQLSPLMVCLMMTWAGYYALERSLALSGCMPSATDFPHRWAYVAMQTRHNFILVAPPLGLMFVQQMIVAIWPGLLQDKIALPLIGLGLVAVMYTSVPLVLRLLLGLTPLPAGQLRDRLLATAKRLSFRFSNILVWDTRRTILNAMVMGPIPWLRYVVVTDRLIEELTPDEIEAVFGHEVGHIKHHHLSFYFAFLMASLIVVVGLCNEVYDALGQSQVRDWFNDYWPSLLAWLNSYQSLSALPLIALMGGYILIVFGYLSRRCERQADIYGCRAVSVPVFVEALEKVARLNGISRDRPGWLLSWQHSTIARRVAFLQRMAADPSVEPRFQKHIRLVKWALVVGLVTLLAALGPNNVWAALGLVGN